MATMRALLESLTSTGISGAIPKEIRASLFEENRKKNPLFRLLPRFSTETNTYFWVKRQGLPDGGPSLEAPPFSGTGSVAASSSSYANNNSVAIKSLTWQGDVSKIAEQVATKVGSVIANEIKGQVEAESRTETVLNLYGSDKASANNNKPQWAGFKQLVSVGTLSGGVPQNVINEGTAISLGVADDLLDILRTITGTDELGGQWCYVMSQKMQTAFNTLYNNTNRTDLPVMSVQPQVDPDVFGDKDADYYAQFVRAMAGIEVKAYRGVPIIPSSFITPNGTMGALTLTHTGTGSAFTGGTTYFYRMEAISRLGKTVASAEASVTPASGENVGVSWTVPTVTDPISGKAVTILGYLLYRSTASGGESLYGYIAGTDVNDANVTSVSDTNAAVDPSLTGSGYFYVPISGAGDGVNVPSLNTKTEDVYLIPINPDICGMAVLNETQTMRLAPILPRSIQFATTADMALALFSPFFAAIATGVTHA